MPFGDRTGPMGAGPRTGRGAGYCAGYGMPGYANPVPGGYGYGRGYGRGFGRGYGRGFGRGYGRWGQGYGWGWNNPALFYAPAPYYNPTPNPSDEMEYLKAEEKSLSDALTGLRKRMDELNEKLKAESGGE